MRELHDKSRCIRCTLLHQNVFMGYAIYCINLSYCILDGDLLHLFNRYQVRGRFALKIIKWILSHMFNCSFGYQHLSSSIFFLCFISVSFFCPVFFLILPFLYLFFCCLITNFSLIIFILQHILREKKYCSIKQIDF